MNTTIACSSCGSRLPADSPAGLCDRCQRAEKPDRLPGVEIGNRDGFLRVLVELKLISAEELGRQLAASGDDPSRLAQGLIRAKALTPYQAKALVKGKFRGLLIGDHLVEEKLGAGGMGAVFKARHRPSGQIVALKILPPSQAPNPDAIRRFRREFEIASRLNHPNVVRAIEAGEARGVHYLTMEYVPGFNLGQLVSRGGPLDIWLALHCAIQAARGIEAAHSQGIVHRDVKPGNIMIDPKGLVRVCDLGLARAIEAPDRFSPDAAGELTRKDVLIGTVDFLAPEQAFDARSADSRSDIYSLGATLHHLLTGRPPFGGGAVLDRLVAHRDRPAPSLRLVRPEVSESLDEVYLRMMAKDPAARPRSMAEVVIALEACRTSAREEEAAGIELLAYAKTVFKKAEAEARARRGPDRSVLDTSADGRDAPSYDPDLRLEDAVADYRDEVKSDPLAEELLPRLGYHVHSDGRKRYPLASLRVGALLLGLGIGAMGGIYLIKAVVGVLRHVPVASVSTNVPAPKPKAAQHPPEAPKAPEPVLAAVKIPEPKPAPKAVELPPPTATERLILARLELPLELDFRNAPLIELLKAIKKGTTGPELPRGIPLFADPLGLQEAKATVRDRVTVRASQEPLKDSLRDALGPLGLTFAVRGDRLLISSKALTDTRVVTGPTGPEAAMPRLETIIELGGVAYAFSNYGVLPEAMEQFQLALTLQRKRSAAYPESEEDRRSLYSCCNYLTTHYSTYLDPADRNPSRAVELANEAVALIPASSLGWENLGWALYSAGDWNGCIRAVEKSIQIDRSGNGYDWFFLAMAHKKLGNATKAKGYYDRGVSWLRGGRINPELIPKARGLREQAADVLGIKAGR